MFIKTHVVSYPNFAKGLRFSGSPDNQQGTSSAVSNQEVDTISLSTNAPSDDSSTLFELPIAPQPHLPQAQPEQQLSQLLLRLKGLREQIKQLKAEKRALKVQKFLALGEANKTAKEAQINEKRTAIAELRQQKRAIKQNPLVQDYYERQDEERQRVANEAATLYPFVPF